MLRRRLTIRGAYYCGLALLIVINYTCHNASTMSRPASPMPTKAIEATPTQESKRDDPFIGFLLQEKLDWMAEAWRQFTANGRYRMAHAEDFALEVRDEMQYPYERTAISHDGGYDDFAIVVVDTTQNNPERFGLVVFNAPKNGEIAPAPRWVYRNKDLSRMVIRKWSGGIILSQYQNTGSQESCYLNWNKLQQKYSCDKEYNGSHLGLPKSRFQKL